MTSWVQSDGPHFVYADAHGRLWQFWYTTATGQWAAQDLTTLSGAVPAGSGMAMTSWVQSDDGPHVVYADATGNLYQVWYTISTGQWAAQSLMNVPNTVPVGPGSAMTSWVQSDDGPHVVYADANGNLYQVWYTIQGSANHAQGWAAGSLMSVPNTVPVGPGSAMTSWVQSDDGPHVAYSDANGNLYQVWYTISTGQWAAQSLMNVPNTVPVGPGSAMTSWMQSDDGPHVVYANANGNLYQVWYTIQGSANHAQGWAAGSLMGVPNTVPVGPGSAMTSWVQSDDGPHFVYADANGHVYQIWYTIQGSANHAQGWAEQELTSVSVI
jgi:20S proteasome alpha/beta subunit